jgi:hypothetical protein
VTLFAFVLMPFARHFNKRYELAIKSAIRDAGMRPERVDQQSFHRKGITDKIIQQIQDADVIIADVSTNNPNVLYEVGYAYAKDKLCILLTNAPNKIPFDLKNRRHVIFSSLDDLKTKLLKELKALKIEMELSFDGDDGECVAEVDVNVYQVTRKSKATSVRVKVKTSSELDVKNVSAQMVEIKRRIGSGSWKRFKPVQPIQLVWTDTNTILTDFDASAPKHANVFHVDHDENKMSIWGVEMLKPLGEFLSKRAKYRVTVSVMGRQIQLDVSWKGHWKTMAVELAQRRA